MGPIDNNNVATVDAKILQYDCFARRNLIVDIWDSITDKSLANVANKICHLAFSCATEGANGVVALYIGDFGGDTGSTVSKQARKLIAVAMFKIDKLCCSSLSNE